LTSQNRRNQWLTGYARVTKKRNQSDHVTDFSAVESLLRNTAERTGRLDYVFNNAGISIGGPVSLHTIEDWNRIIDVNLRGVVNGVQAAYQIMLSQGFGHIVNTASLVITHKSGRT
jgi:NADP-dependent 3-hydroxy acid dehydrogenase YdfG